MDLSLHGKNATLAPWQTEKEKTALECHYNDVIVGTIASQITSLTMVYSTVYSDAGQRKHQSSASLASVRGIHRGSSNSPHKWPVTRKMFPFDDVIMLCFLFYQGNTSFKSSIRQCLGNNGKWIIAAASLADIFWIWYEDLMFSVA